MTTPIADRTNWTECDWCDGTGEVDDDAPVTCPACDGRGGWHTPAARTDSREDGCFFGAAVALIAMCLFVAWAVTMARGGIW